MSTIPTAKQLQIVLTTLTATGGHALAALKRGDLITLDSHLATLQAMLDLAGAYRHANRPPRLKGQAHEIAVELGLKEEAAA